MQGVSGLPVTTFQQRIATIQQAVTERGLDALFVFSDEYRPGHTLYLSDYYPINVIEESPQGVYVPAQGEVTLFLGAINAQTAREVSWIQDIRSIEDLPAFLQERVDRKGRRLRIGLAGETLLPVRYYRLLRSALDENAFVSADDLLHQMRERKSREEIALMQEAAHLGDQAIKAALARLRQGEVTEVELAAVAEYTIRSQGGHLGSATVLSAGHHTRLPTWRPSLKKIMPGEAVLIDVNPSWHGYCSDVSVTVFHGEMTREQAELLALSRQIHRGVITRLRPGLPASFIYDYFLDRVRAAGYERFFTPYAQGMRAVGHGVGLDVVERPNLDAGSTFLLAPGMTLAIKFDLHGFDFGGIRQEVVVAIEEDGCRALNNILEEEF
ncbi:MAG: aminopeptidase P family protein [Nitrospinota bacterium]|nr:MAG: aminopeptidase P family protein [Nitrospinota bacterium]